MRRLLLYCLAAVTLAGCPQQKAAPDPPRAAPDPQAYERAVRDAKASARARDHRGAALAWERALALDPGDDVMVYRVALATLRAGDPAGAMKWLTRLADAGSDLVPWAVDFKDLSESPAYGAAYRAVLERARASAARHRRGTEAFRVGEKGLLPEGIAYDPVERAFYLGSTTRRKIVKIVEGRPPTDLLSPRPDVESIGGLRVDAGRRRLWAVAGTDPRQDGFVKGAPERNALVEIDLAKGEVLRVVPLDEPGRHGLNDVAVDASGRPFSTDSAAGQVYTLGEGRSLAPLFAAPPYVVPNGIAFDDEGKVLFVADDVGVHRVDVAARTTRLLPHPPGTSLASFDGLYFQRSAAGSRLVGVQIAAGPGRVVEATLSQALDAVTGVRILESDHPLFEGPTTGAVVGDALFVIANSQLWAPREPAETIILRVPL
jgi:sugar lactone lactonase YvrE